MKRLLYACIVSLSMLFLSACGGGGDGVITSLNIDLLESGYNVRFKDNANDIIFKGYFCHNKVHFFLDDGTPTVSYDFLINGDHIDMSNTGDTYTWYLDISAPTPSILEVGLGYFSLDSDGHNKSYTVVSIEKTPCS